MLIMSRIHRLIFVGLLTATIPTLAQQSGPSIDRVPDRSDVNTQNITSEVARVDWNENGFYLLLDADIYLRVTRKTMILDAQEKPLSLLSLEEGDRVAISYDVRGQPKTAVFIQRLPRGGRP